MSTENNSHELVRVSRQMVDELLARDSEPVILVRLERQEDGTCDMILKTPEAAPDEVVAYLDERQAYGDKGAYAAMDYIEQVSGFRRADA